MDKTRRKYLRFKLRPGLKAPESGILLLAVLSLIVLSNPSPEDLIRAVVLAVLFLAGFALFMVPGLVLGFLLLPGPELSVPARIPLAFTLSAGVFGLAALPSLLLDNSLFLFYPYVRYIIGLSLGLAVVRIVWRRPPAENGEHPTTDLATKLLWVPFLLLAGVLAQISAAHVPKPGEDAWIFLSYVVNFVTSGKVAGAETSSIDMGASRVTLNGWLPVQRMLSSISELDPITLVLHYLAPTLVLVALLALYALARTLLKSEKAALVVGSLSALFLLAALGSPSFDSVLAPGGEFVNFITEDKFVARYVFVPVALSLAILFVRNRSWRNLGLFFFVCLSSAVVHPLGLVFIGIPTAGFGLVHLAINRRDRGAWWRIGGLWFALFVLIVPPALYLLATGSPLLSKLETANPETAATLIGTWQYEHRLLQIGEGSFVAHPSLLLDPAMLVAYVLGVPFLIWKIKQTKDSLAAQLLLGVLAFTPILIFVPYTATLISSVIGPWLLYRLTWPLLLGALLTLTWMCWEAFRFVSSRLSGFDSTRRVAPFVPLIVLGALLVGAIPLVLGGLRAAEDPDKIAQGDTSCLDPTFRWMQSLPLDSHIMAPRLESSCIKAYLPSAYTLGEDRGDLAPAAQQDMKGFLNARALAPETLQILQRNEMSYVLLPANSPLDVQLEHLGGLFTRMANPGERYRMYAVNNSAIYSMQTDKIDADQSDLASTRTKPLIHANGNLNDGEWDEAVEAYTTLTSQGTPEVQFLAYLGLGRAYTEKGLYAEAAKNYEAATEVDPESSAAHDLVANAYAAAGEKDQARTEFERAIELDPENVDLRLRYGQFLVPVDQQDAVEQYRTVVEMYPKVPDYRVKLGAALLLLGDTRNADEQFEGAIYLSPRLVRLWADIGDASLLSGYPQKALGYYEEALAREPNSQLYALNLGKAHGQLSTLNGGRDKGHFEEAETLFKRVEDLDHRPWEPDQREAARIALGDLYLAWDRPEDAATAYERALELNPDSEKAKKKLDELR